MLSPRAIREKFVAYTNARNTSETRSRTQYDQISGYYFWWSADKKVNNYSNEVNSELDPEF